MFREASEINGYLGSVVINYFTSFMNMKNTSRIFDYDVITWRGCLISADNDGKKLTSCYKFLDLS